MGDTRRFEADVRAERATANLRLAGSAVVLACAVWMMATGPGALGWLFAILALLAGLGWAAAGLAGRRRAGRAPESFIEVGPEGVLLADAGRRLQIPWSEVGNVRVDEDRLVIALERRSGDPFVVQPRYRGVGLHELARVLRDAHRRASARGGG